MRLIPEKNPKPIRAAAYATFGMFVVVSAATALRTVIDNPTKTGFELFLGFLFSALLGVLGGLAVLWGWWLIGKLGHKATLKNADATFQQSGYGTALAGAFTAAPYPEDDDVVISAYLLTAAEHYKEAEEALIPIDRTAVSQRTLAMLNTTLLRLYFMTGRQEKIRRHLENTAARTENSFQMKPEMLNEYKPYLDDIFDYALLIAVYATQQGDRETADKYMRQVMSRISLRDEADRALYPQIVDLSMLYAQRRFEEAHELEQRLRGEIANYGSPLTQPHRDELRRRLEQARVFTPYFDQKAEAALQRQANNADASMERKLPTEAQLQQGIRPEDCGLELF